MKLVKRTFDLCSSCLALIILSPIMVFVSLLIKLDSSGPVIFKQDRIGKDGNPFVIHKFRTMTVGAGNGPVIAGQKDGRMTRVGPFLRQWSLDEIPQFFNVLKGDMSLVGPRPDRTFRLSAYTKEQKRRLEVKPGITGWATINGRNSISWQKRYELDLEYVDNQSFWFDLKILLKSVPLVLIRFGVDVPTEVPSEKKKELT